MKKILSLIIISLLLIASSFAQEGMWLLNQIDKLDLRKKGLQIEISKIYSKDKPALYNAIVQVGGGSASFVSPEGLIITNHHVAYTALQRASSAQNDYLKDGFLAKNRSEEIIAPGYTARILLEMKDVTKDVTEAMKEGKDPMEKEKLKNKFISAQREKLEKDDIQITISEMFNGKQYFLFVYKTFKDVRIVYAPPGSIGNYGGEIDNWMWPRHTGDFSFMRVYVDKAGKGKEYSKDNIPYKPKVWLRVAKGNLKEGDFTFIMGFPGFTTRYRSSTSVDYNLNVNYPFTIQNFKEIIKISETLTENDREGRIKVSDLIKGLANTMKNYEGKVSGMIKTNFLQKKLDFEKEFVVWVNSKPELKKKYGDILQREKETYNLISKTKNRDNVFNLFFGLSGLQMSVANQIYSLAKEKEKPENERQPGFSEETIQETIEGLVYTYNDYYEPVDKALFIRTLKKAKELPSDNRIESLDYIFDNKDISIESYAEKAFSVSRLKDIEFAKSLFTKTSAELESLDDPFIKLAVKLYPLAEEIQRTNLLFSANVTAIRKEYLDALFEWKGTSLYPDANSTMRFTWGPVRGYKPADAVTYYPFTTLRGVIEKNTGTEPFDAPAKLIELYNTKNYGRWIDPVLKDVPVAFTHMTDITGGNSGSPVMNAQGEIIGVAFDGNYEAMISDWQYDYDLQRTISVDIRYVLFITEKFADAKFLLNEIGVR